MYVLAYVYAFCIRVRVCFVFELERGVRGYLLSIDLFVVSWI